MHPAWQRAREECLAALTEGDRVLLCGVPGTGKSMLLHDIAETLRSQGRSVVLQQHGDPVVEPADTDVVLVDEADRLSSGQIRLLCLRPNPLLLAGLPGLRERVIECVGLLGSVTLEPLSIDDVVQLVAARLAGAGRASTLFSPKAVIALAQRSGGLFRVVVILAGAALFFAEMRGAETVTATDIDEAAAMREAIADETDEDAAATEPESPPRSDAARWPRRVLTAVVVVMAAIGVMVHLAGTAGGPASAAVDALRAIVHAGATPAALQVQAEPPPPARLQPKRPLSSLRKHG